MPQDDCLDCDDWRDEAVWEKANPNLQYLGEPFRDYLRRQVEEAKQMPGQVNIVKRLNFCIWTESLTKWIGSETWSACGFPVDAAALRGRTCYGGLDLSTTLDVTALVLAFPPAAGESRYQLLCRFFIPKDNILQRVKRDRVPYDVWVRQGWITATPGNVVDYNFILEQVKKDLEAFDLRDIGFDRWGSAKIAQDLLEIGGDDFVVQIGQGFASMASPTKEFERLIHSKEIAHGNNPVLSWMISNVVMRQDPAGNIKPDKDKSTEKIDGVVAAIMAIDRATRSKPDDSDSIYDTRGILMLEPDDRAPLGWR